MGNSAGAHAWNRNRTFYAGAADRQDRITNGSHRQYRALYYLKTDEVYSELAVIVRYSGHAEARLTHWLKRADQHRAAWYRLHFSGCHHRRPPGYGG
jgi:hypothetical protein